MAQNCNLEIKRHWTLMALLVLAGVWASPLLSQELAKDAVRNLQERYTRGFEDTILTPYQAKKGQLDEKFLGALAKDLDAAKQTGDLDHLVATEAHIEAIQKGELLPGEPENAPDSLKTLRGIYLDQLKTLDDHLLDKTRPLLPHMDQSYKSLEVRFTQKGLKEDALVVRDERNRLQTEGLSFLPFPVGVRSPLLTDALSVADAQEVTVTAGDGLPFIPFASLPTGTVRVLKKDGLKIMEEIPPGKDKKHTAVRVLPTPHYSDYLTKDGVMCGHLTPHREQNGGLVQISTSYLNPMALNQKGQVVFSRQLAQLPKGLDPSTLVNVKSIAANSHAAAVLFEDGTLQAWSVGRDKEPEMMRLGKMHDDLIALWATSSVIFGRRASNQRFEIVHSPVDAGDFRNDLNRHKFKTFDAYCHTNFVIGIREKDGRVEVLSSNNATPPDVPKDLGVAVQVRTGNTIFAAQLQDGSWRVWGQSKFSDLIARYEAL